MNITDDSYARAAAAIAGLKAAGGFDLTGYEHLWADITPELAISAMIDGEIWVSVDGKWTSFGVAQALQINDEVDQVDVTLFNPGSGHRSFVGGLRHTTLRAEIAFTNDVWHWLQLHGHDKFSIRVGAQGHVIETEAIMERTEAEISGGISIITVHAVVTGRQTLHKP